MTALGRPVSHALEIPHGLHAAALREVVRAIDAVHGNGDLPRIPISWGPLVGRDGQFRTDRATGAPIRIVVRTSGTLRRLAALHEVGHFLDHQGIGVPGAFASVRSRLLGPWRAAVRQSRATQELIALRSSDRVAARRFSDASDDAFHRRPFVRYLVTCHEALARCYAQLVVIRSGEPWLLEELEARRLASPGIPQQWDDEDFAPIASEIERLLRRLRWLD